MARTLGAALVVWEGKLSGKAGGMSERRGRVVQLTEDLGYDDERMYGMEVATRRDALGAWCWERRVLLCGEGEDVEEGDEVEGYTLLRALARALREGRERLEASHKRECELERR